MKKIILMIAVLLSATSAFAVESIAAPATRTTDIDASVAKQIWAAGPTDCEKVMVCALNTNTSTIQAGYGATWAGGTDLYGLPASGDTCTPLDKVVVRNITKYVDTTKVWLKSAGNDNQGATIRCVK